MFKGSFVALVTPFGADGEVDYDTLRKLVDWHAESGTDGLVPVGTTGETPTLSHDEHRRVVATVIEHCAGRMKVIAGAGSNSTREAISLVAHAQEAGADAALVVTPYYNKPTQDGLYAHYRAIHDATDLPVMIYNIPGRSVVDMIPATMARLAELPRIVGVKDATGDVIRVSEQRALCGTDFVQLSGEDASALGFNAHGGVGCIGVTANVAPALCAEFQHAMQDGDWARALELQDRLMPLHKAVFTEPGLAGAKYGLSLLGRCREDVRLPIVPLTGATRTLMKDAMKAAGVLG
ncbi:4-hydroxy-tetrahydrodipicolinate synthase [Palleronia sediminis]|uniref:4-hydroxy-tetrahydrodipicolinate synthase n=1 Tax=Palleronia sediminis TaxID=2547833 RepID=A0A4V3B9H9_9RHOB|nr:4-hydroxy-tetrahydrodipicolinate synthase [Palleronia sediminis]TDL79369.1 4-hydroxy-tetrahydrodipicolinate synthase [Palleronia sediminis]